MTAPPRIAFLASPTEPAMNARARLVQRYGDHPLEMADVVCALGGDGFMLQTLHRHGAADKPVFGMKLGSVGFLMNQYRDGEDDLLARLQRAEPAHLRPLEMLVQTESGTSAGSLAYNEVSLLRQTRQAAHLSVDLNGQTRIAELIGDGVMVAGDVRTLARKYCKDDVAVTYRSYSLSHFTSIASWLPETISWLTARFNGKPATDNCASIPRGNPLPDFK